MMKRLVILKPPWWPQPRPRVIIEGEWRGDTSQMMTQAPSPCVLGITGPDPFLSLQGCGLIFIASIAPYHIFFSAPSSQLLV